ncbi:MAG: ribonuclease H-like YkuK family protein [Parcubacteria group bacterium]|nr:ribonuclease H-like YkuK family protein [Parcubacteria group bacterium]
MNFFDSQFNSPTKGILSLREVVEEVMAYLDESPDDRFILIVGSDSQNHVGTDYVTAIVAHHVGRGGRYFWTRQHDEKNLPLRQRIYQEATRSMELAQELVKLLGERAIAHNVEIHVDVGQNGPTREMIREVVGMIRGSGFAVKVKPEAYGAFVVADRYT